MSELLKSYDNGAGRTAQVRYNTAPTPRSFGGVSPRRSCIGSADAAKTGRPFWVEARAAACGSGVASRGVKMLCGTYRTQQEAEHAAAHFMATGDLPAAAEGSGVPSPKPETAQKPREGVDATPGAVSTHAAPETHFATPLQRQSAPIAQARHTSTRGKAAEFPKS